MNIVFTKFFFVVITFNFFICLYYYYHILSLVVLGSLLSPFRLTDDAKLRRFWPHSNNFLFICSKSMRQMPFFYDTDFIPFKICRTKAKKGYKSC